MEEKFENSNEDQNFIQRKRNRIERIFELPKNNVYMNYSSPIVIGANKIQSRVNNNHFYEYSPDRINVSDNGSVIESGNFGKGSEMNTINTMTNQSQYSQQQPDYIQKINANIQNYSRSGKNYLNSNYRINTSNNSKLSHNASSQMTFNPSHDLYKRINILKLESNFFKNEYEKALGMVKSINPEFYFKSKLDMIQDSINNTKIFSTEFTNSPNYNKENEINSIDKSFFSKYLKNINNKDNDLLKFCIVASIFGVYLYLNRSIFLEDFTFQPEFMNNFFTFMFKNSFFIVISLICAFCIYKLQKSYQQSQINHNKLLADKILTEIEDHLQNKPEGTLIKQEEFIISFCNDSKMKVETFKNGILKEMRGLIESNQQNTGIIEIEVLFDGRIEKCFKLK